MKNCEYCKAAMPDDAVKCPSCGAHVKNTEYDSVTATADSATEGKIKEKMTKKQRGLLIASCIISFIAFVIEIYAAVVFGIAIGTSSSSDGQIGTAVMLIVFLPLWFVFGCTTAGVSVIYNLCIMTSLGKKWFLPLIFAVVVLIATVVVIIEIFCINSSGASEETVAYCLSLLNSFRHFR